MGENTELKLLVDRVLTDRRFCGDENHKALADGVLALIAENESVHKHWQNESNNVQVLVAEFARLKAENKIFEEGMRSIACSLSAGGYNAETLTATQLVEKVQWGVDHFADTSGRMVDQLRAEIAGLKTGYEAYEQVNAELKAEVEGLRATADLQKLLPEVSDALEELELHGLHSDQGYRKLKDWHRKVGLAYRVIQGPMFGAEHGELVSQNTWLRSVVEHYAQQHAPLEPIPDMEGWSARLPGYDLPSLLRDAERYRRVRDIACRVRAYVGFHLVVQLPSPSGSSFCAAKAFDEAIDAVLGQGEQS